MRNAIVAAIAIVLLAAPFGAHAAGYYVYCANNKIEVDSRDFNQMKSARGSGICQLSSFGFRSDAESFAKKNFGGPGKKCSCR
ncbi:MAG: hypothetical protein KF889_10790 [Alphaproteobacteria bacterium]|nr:hypothetical protein [Alphaproteobacteria bacterium]MCW5741311.1 hypothetical protein [Alphaproteobacteria bacterium]